MMSRYCMQEVVVVVIVCSFSFFGNVVLDQQRNVTDSYICPPYVLNIDDNTRNEERKPPPTNNKTSKCTVKYVYATHPRDNNTPLATPVLPKEALTILATPAQANEASIPLATPVRPKEALILATPGRSIEESAILATPVRPNESTNSSVKIIRLSDKDGPAENGNTSTSKSFPHDQPQNNHPRKYPDKVNRSTRIPPRVTNMDKTKILSGAPKSNYMYSHATNRDEPSTIPVLPVKEPNQANNSPHKPSTAPPEKNIFILAKPASDKQPNESIEQSSAQQSEVGLIDSIFLSDLKSGNGKCEVPKIENGNAECKNIDGNSSLVCNFTCNDSYKLGNWLQKISSCKNGSWSPYSVLPSCVSIETEQSKEEFIDTIFKKDFNAGKPKCEKPKKFDNGSVKCENTEGSTNLLCKFTCHKRYVLEGGSSLASCKNGSWSPEYFPNCVQKCNTLRRPFYGDVECGDENRYCKFTCDPDYTLDGKEKILCRNGNWEDAIPKCKRNIENTNCTGPTNLEKGTVNCENTEKNTVLLCQFICDEHYVLEDGSKSLASCKEGIWSSERPLKCVKKCKNPYKPDHGGFNCSAENQVCHFHCDPDYELRGPHTIDCLAGFWTEKAPTCKKKCQIPDKPLNGHVKCIGVQEDDSSNTVLKPKYDVLLGRRILERPTFHIIRRVENKVCKFLCDTGYQLQGKAESYCKEGRYDVPTCEVVGKCKPPRRPFYGDVECGDENRYCKFTCDPHYTLDGQEKILCRNGNWEDEIPKCKRKIERR